MPRRRRGLATIFASSILLVLLVVLSACLHGDKQWTPYKRPADWVMDDGRNVVDFRSQTEEQAAERSRGCMTCHEGVEQPHPVTKSISCIDCHGGDGQATDIETAHPKPRHPEAWKSAANPERSYTLLNDESWEWIRFVNPGDLRVANTTCGGCHPDEVIHVMKSLMTTSAHFWGVATYANGVVSSKETIVGESYSPEGIPQIVRTVPEPTPEERERGVVPLIAPLPRFEASQTGNVFRIFEQGSRLGTAALGFNGAPQPLVGVPDKLEDPGRPNNRTSDRGFGTLLRIDLPTLNIHKTRLNDPHLSFLGTNDHPGDYRSSGCTACHMVYANDRQPMHAGPYAAFGHDGTSRSADPQIKKDEPGHPLKHKFTTGIPSSQCMVCHMHQPNSFVNSFYGYTMWNYDTDGELMWPEKQVDPSHSRRVSRLDRNPEGAAVAGKWGDREFLKDVADLNPKLKHTQFADYHGHGWVFRAAFKMDRRGNLLDKDGNVVDYDDPKKFEGVIPELGKATRPPYEVPAGKPVHLKDIHAERGMHCVDCHFEQDVHGDGKLYTSYQAAIEISCKDCHGTVYERANLTTSGPASATTGGNDLTLGKTPWGRRFRRDGDKIIQRSMLHEGLEWVVPQVRDGVDDPDANPVATRAHTMQRDNRTWGSAPSDRADLAHGGDTMECYACHTAFITSCFGCHLPQEANWRTKSRHFDHEGHLRQYASYNPQVVRDSEFMLGISGKVKGSKYAPVRSSSALLLSSVDAARQKTYIQVPPIAANGMSSQLFNTHFPHTVRTKETRACDDCHLSESEDNNAWLAQTYLLGTNLVNFIGYNAWVGAGGGGVHAVRVTEWEEPQAVIGSHLHRMAYPANHAKHVKGGRILKDSEHHGSSYARGVQMRGEYLYIADGPGGFRVMDIANVANKGFSEKIVTAPVSPLGQDTHVSTRHATAVALATNNRTTMSRVYRPENGEQKYVYDGKVQNLHETYRYAYVTDLHEGLVVVDVDSVTDGEPRNNFIERVATFNPDGLLDGAVNLAVAGATAYVCCDRGVVAVDISDPRNPRAIAEVGSPHVVKPRSIAVQFRYAFVCDERGVQVLDVTRPAQMRAVQGARVDLADARDIYVARWYGYVSAGAEGLVLLDLEKPAAPRVFTKWNADGAIDDLNQVKVGMTNDSAFAYLADGRNGLRVVRVFSPADGQPRSHYGFSPAPALELIATFPTSTPALAVSKGLDRDRAVDESGHQMAAFGRIGARPLNLEEMRRLFMRDGEIYRVSNRAKTAPVRSGGDGR